MKHVSAIPKGEHGELSKIREELAELEDAHSQRDRAFVAVEAADLVNSVTRFCWKHYGIPGTIVIALYWVRILYKKVRRKR